MVYPPHLSLLLVSQWLQLLLYQMPHKYVIWILSFKSVFPPIIQIFPQEYPVSTSLSTCQPLLMYFFYHMLNFTFWSFTHVAAYSYSSFTFTPLQYSIIWAYFNLFPHLLWDEYLGCLGSFICCYAHVHTYKKSFPRLWN